MHYEIFAIVNGFQHCGLANYQAILKKKNEMKLH